MAKRKRDKRTSNELQSNTHKAKNRVTRIPLINQNSCVPEG